MEKIKIFWSHFRSALEFKLIDISGHSISIYNVVVLIGVLLFFRFLVKALERFVKMKVADKKWIDHGKEHAVVQISKYLIYVVGFVIALEAIGLNTTTIIISSSALFVGLGFGLQEAFRDFISGIILLFEGNVVVGDVIEMDMGIVGVVKRVNLRTSKVRTRDGIMIIVPNSQLVNLRVINWSNSNKLTRFHVTVGVSYGSDVALVEKLLLEAASELEFISERMKPFVRFEDFGNSALVFEIHFWTEEVWKIEDSKSKLRFTIDKKFREHKVTIPFPQRDLHLKSSEVPLGKA